MQLDDIRKLITEQISDAVLGEDMDSTPKALIIDRVKIKEVCRLLKNHEQCFFDQLACLTGLDNGAESDSLEVIYNLYSIPFNVQLMLKVGLSKQKPELDSVYDIWATADWLERECFDLVGIHFTDHPDLRRILLPEDWEGHPLRKDYQEQEKYHGINVKY